MVALWETAPAMYNMPTTIEFHGNLQKYVHLLKDAMLHVVRQQQGLRTIVQFDMKTNRVMQQVLPQDLADKCLEFVELEASDDEEARLIIERESGFIFDLTKPPGEFRWIKVHTIAVGIDYILTNVFFAYLHQSDSGRSRQDTQQSPPFTESACKDTFCYNIYLQLEFQVKSLTIILFHLSDPKTARWI